MTPIASWPARRNGANPAGQRRGILLAELSAVHRHLRTTIAFVLLVLSSALACMPGGSTFPPDASPVVEVPVVVRHGVVLVPVHIDGIERELTFLLDTGAPTVVRNEIAAELGLTRTQTGGLTDAAGANLASTAIEIEGLHVGALHMRRVPAFAAQLPDLGAFCVELDGVLGVGAERGTGFLDRTAIAIDYAGQRLALAPTADDLAREGISVPVRRHELRADGSSVTTTPIVEVELGGVRRWVAIDTGNSGAIDMSPSVFAELGRSFDEPGLVTRTGALSLTATMQLSGVSYETRLDALGLGELKLRGVPITVQRPEQETVELEGASKVLIGYQLLRNFRFVLDVANGVARFVTVPGADPSAPARGLGFSWRELDGKVAVVTLLTPGPAQRSGIALGDELLAVDGVELRAGDVAGQCAVRAAIDAVGEQAMAIRVRRDGTVREVELRAEPVLPPMP